jgi:peroxiredoxin/mono/diheme cytochrome c family protein
MRRFTLILSSLLLFPPSLSFADTDPATRRVPDFELTDLRGKPWSLSEQKNRFTVVVFVSTECPMSNAYLKPLSELATKFEEKGVAFVGVDANRDETPEQLAKHAREFGVTFPLFRDDDLSAVKALEAKVNPEVFILDAEFRLRYRGRIDDAYSARLKPNPTVTRYDLHEALSSLVEGKEVKVKVTTAFGCPLPGVEKKSANPNATVTYYKDVLPVLQANCQSCHRPGNVGPFSLMNYRQAVKWADSMMEEVKGKRMPPWKPERNEFLPTDRCLTAKDIATLSSWVEQGMAEGNAKDAPPPVKFPEGWSLGTPDLILEAPEDVVIDATGRDVFHCLVFPTNFPEDRLIAAVEVQPGNPRVVHHTIHVLDPDGHARRLQERFQKKMTPETKDRGPGYSVSMGIGFLPHPANNLGGWAPGLVPKRLPDGLGYNLKKGADVVVQIHYHRTGKVERDRTRVGLYFAKGERKAHFQSIAVPGIFLSIPPNEKQYKIDQKYEVNEDLVAHWLVPHMHLLGRDIELLMQRPGEEEKSLIQIKDWDYNWQEMYQLKEPVKLPKGTTMRIRATFDNSSGNPLNPSSPPRNVRIGEQTTDEMCFVFMGVAAPTRSWLKLSIPVPKE